MAWNTRNRQQPSHTPTLDEIEKEKRKIIDIRIEQMRFMFQKNNRSKVCMTRHCQCITTIESDYCDFCHAKRVARQIIGRSD